MLAKTRTEPCDAAWALDDAKKPALARTWRSKAADLFLTLLNANGSFVDEPGAPEVILTACLRRAGRGPETLDVAERGLQVIPPDPIQNIPRLQKSLITRSDTDCHLIQEAMLPT